MILRAVLISTFVLAEAATSYAATARATIHSIDVNGVGPVVGTVTFKKLCHECGTHERRRVDRRYRV